MKRPFLLLCVTMFVNHAIGTVNHYRIGRLVVENIPEIPTALIQRLAPYRRARNAIFRDWLPDDRGMLITTRFGDVSQVHMVETPGGARHQLTFFDDPIDYVVVCPHPDEPIILFTKDSAGNEVTQIYAYNLKTHKHRLLTDGTSRHRSLVCSHQGNQYAFSSTMRNGRDFDIYIGTVVGKESFQPLVQYGGYWIAVDFSPDDQKLLVKQYVSSSESYYYIVDLKTKEMLQINPTTQKISYGTARWSRDAKGIYMTSDEFSDFQQLVYYDLTLKTCEVLTKQILFDVTEFELAPFSSTIAFVVNEDGWSRLYLMDVKTHRITQARLVNGQLDHLKFKSKNNKLAFVLNRPTSPSDVFSIDLKKNIFIRWTYSEVGDLDTSTFVEPTLIYYPTFDSINGKARTIPVFYYKPTGGTPPYPVLIDCHGGPAVQYTPRFSMSIQFLVKELGIAYIVPNIRGSSGYGKEYLDLDNFYKREDAIRDIGALLDWIEEQPDLDASRIGMSGGSYGGYVVLASMVHYSDRLRCGIDEWGISNFVTFLENTGEYRQDLRRVEYGDERNPEMQNFLNRISPLTNAHKIKKPLFIIQGLNDPRVPVTEAEQIVEAVRKNGVDVWYLLAEDEGHGFSKKPNWDFYRAASILFLEKYLLR